MTNFTYENWLSHFNPNHDPNNGQFAKNPSGKSSKQAKAEKKFAKQNHDLTLYREAAKEAYNRSANALTYLDSEKKSERRDAGDYAARMYEIGEMYKKKAEKKLKEINKDGTKVMMSSLDPYSVAIGEAFVKRSLAGRMTWMINPAVSAKSSSIYKLNNEKAANLGRRLKNASHG
ncbi:MAG: hypothetical protein J6U54_17595 [Clostridiales bacterium]|nr:hypothetical protein [Clostridiales bacterium]